MSRMVVTGGASGVGEALVERLNNQGIEAWVLDLKPPSADRDGVHFLETDLSVEESIDTAIAGLPETLDGIANVAGIAQAEDPATVLAVNFLGLRHLTHHLVGRLSPGSAVVSVSSVAGRGWAAKYDRLMPLLESQSFAAGMEWCRGQNEVLARDPYSLSKQLVTAWTLRSAQAALKRNVRINCVSPGPIATPLYASFESLMGRDQSEWMQAQTGRAATPMDIAEVIDLLLTGECRWLNGVDVPVDGGYTAGMESGWINFDDSPLMRRIRQAKGG